MPLSSRAPETSSGRQKTKRRITDTNDMPLSSRDPETSSGRQKTKKRERPAQTICHYHDEPLQQDQGDKKRRGG